MGTETQVPAQDPEASEILRSRLENGNHGKSRFQKKIDKLTREKSEGKGRIAELQKDNQKLRAEIAKLTEGLRLADKLIGEYKLALRRRNHGQ